MIEEFVDNVKKTSCANEGKISFFFIYFLCYWCRRYHCIIIEIILMIHLKHFLHTKEQDQQKNGFNANYLLNSRHFEECVKKNTELGLKFTNLQLAGILILIITTNRFAFRELKLIALSLCKQKMRWKKK